MNEPDYLSSLSSNILALRKEHNLTQEALAEKLGITFQAVSKWENGQSYPDIALLPILADIFNVGIDELRTQVRTVSPRRACFQKRLPLLRSSVG